MKKKILTRDLIFYILMLAYPVIQFCIFYIGVNGKSILYAFQTVTKNPNGIGYVSNWSLETLKDSISVFFSPEFLTYGYNSLILFLVTFIASTFLSLLFSYFIYKKLPLSNLFKLFLFIPSIISSAVLITIFKYIVNDGIPFIAQTYLGKEIKGLLDTPGINFWVLIFYEVFVGFGTKVLMFSNAMSAISPEIIEAGKIDGASPLREFFSIVIPGIFPTIITFTITGIAGLFTVNYGVVSLYGINGASPENIKTIGYYLYRETAAAGTSELIYPRLSAIGIYLTAITIPLTLGVKKLMEKFGPSTK